ncbi:TPA: hypothetical protein DCX15_02095 [bacterium]|nr:hypothetical protein [bacterium]
MKTKRIVQENIKAANTKIANIAMANEMLKRVRGQILGKSSSAFSAYGNLQLSGKHIVWKTRKQ